MKFWFVLVFTIMLFQTNCLCQTKAKINDVDFHLDGNYVVVNYTIVGSLPKEQMTIDLRFITEDNKPIIPQTVSGDIGTDHFEDGIKTILWDIVSDQIVLSGNLKAIVTITSSKILSGGPSNALLSVIVPGLGGYFVEDNKIRSIATAVSTLGLLGYGISQKSRSNKLYDEYKASIEPTEIESFYDKANSAHHRYYISTRVAAGIWAFDIVWTVIKGFQNKKSSQSYYGWSGGDGLRLDFANNGLQLKYSISF